jgi:hypothetical protein
VVRLALADATVPQIATFTEHSLRDVEAILDAHYLGRDVQLAEIAVMKLETRNKTVKTRCKTCAVCSEGPPSISLRRLVGAQGLEPWTR